MSRFLLPAALAVAALVSAAAAWREFTCGACGGGVPLGVLGTGFYACAALATVLFGPRKPIVYALFAALGVHAGLVTLMLTRGPFCITCILAAAASLSVSALLIARDPARLEPAVAIAPWSAAAVFLLPVHPAARDIDIPSTPGAPVQITVYTRDGCPYCDQLRDRVLPEALREMGDLVSVRWVQAPPELRTPSLILSRADQPGGRLIEGLPPADFLRRELVRLLQVAR